mgnify:CR=1 FL=1
MEEKQREEDRVKKGRRFAKEVGGKVERRVPKERIGRGARCRRGKKKIEKYLMWTAVYDNSAVCNALLKVMVLLEVANNNTRQ